MARHVVLDGGYCTVSTLQGSRDTQEDRAFVHRLVPPFGHYKVLTVCDGHGGSACVDFVGKTFPDLLTNLLHAKLSKGFKQFNMHKLLQQALSSTVTAWDHHSIGKVAVVDDASRAKAFADIDLDDYLAKELDSGTTLVACVVDELRRQIWVISLGDSRCVCRIGKHSLFETVDHAVPDTKAPSGPFSVTYDDGRMCDDLTMTHAIGDNTPVLFGCVNRTPNLYTIRVPPGETAKLILATDGLFDLLSSQKVFLNDRRSTEELLTLDLANMELHDNTTAIMYIMDSKK